MAGSGVREHQNAGAQEEVEMAHRARSPYPSHLSNMGTAQPPKVTHVLGYFESLILEETKQGLYCPLRTDQSGQSLCF